MQPHIVTGTGRELFETVYTSEKFRGLGIVKPKMEPFMTEPHFVLISKKSSFPSKILLYSGYNYTVIYTESV